MLRGFNEGMFPQSVSSVTLKDLDKHILPSFSSLCVHVRRELFAVTFCVCGYVSDGEKAAFIGSRLDFIPVSAY